MQMERRNGMRGLETRLRHRKGDSMSINSKDKGKRGERELANLLREHGYKEAKRSVQYCGVNGDADVIDALEGIHIECKRNERLNIYEAMEQAQTDAREGEKPAVFHRKNRKPWLVTMRLEDWLELYEGATHG